MVIAIGSTNSVKVQALQEVISSCPLLSKLSLISISVASEVSDQPLSLEETIYGAKNRAKNAFEACPACIYSFGIESGLMEVPQSKTGYMEACMCCIFDGKEYYMGQSCSFELPQLLIDLIVVDKKNLEEACYQAGLSQNQKLGAAEGIIGVFTKGRFNRKEYTKQAIITSLIPLENAHLFCRPAELAH